MQNNYGEMKPKVSSRLPARRRCAASLHIDDKTAQLTALDAQIAQAGFWDDAQRAQTVSKQASSLRDTIDAYNAAVSLLDDARAAHELAGEDPLFAEEVQQTLETLDGKLDALEVESWFSGRFDDGDCILTVSPGQGGLEAQDWTEMLYNMYSRYADSKGWKVKVLDLVPGAEAVGLNKATLQIEGRLAYGMLRSENGVHRLVRISPTDVKQRRHTTFAAVEVLPVLPDDIEVNLDMNDVRVDVYRSSGPGGQCVNTTDSAVRLTHMPGHRGHVPKQSQLQNKDAAIRVLKSKLYEIEQQKTSRPDRRSCEMTHGEAASATDPATMCCSRISWSGCAKRRGDGHNVVAVLDGDIDQFVVGYHKWRVSQE